MVAVDVDVKEEEVVVETAVKGPVPEPVAMAMVFVEPEEVAAFVEAWFPLIFCRLQKINATWASGGSGSVQARVRNKPPVASLGRPG